MKNLSFFLVLVMLMAVPLRVNAMESSGDEDGKNKSGKTDSDRTEENSKDTSNQSAKDQANQAGSGTGSGSAVDDNSLFSGKTSTVNTSDSDSKATSDEINIKEDYLVQQIDSAQQAAAHLKSEKEHLESNSLSDASRSAIKSAAERDHTVWQEINRRYASFLEKTAEREIPDATRDHILNLIEASNEVSKFAQEILDLFFQKETVRLPDSSSSFNLDQRTQEEHDQQMLEAKKAEASWCDEKIKAITIKNVDPVKARGGATAAGAAKLQWQKKADQIFEQLNIESLEQIEELNKNGNPVQKIQLIKLTRLAQAYQGTAEEAWNAEMIWNAKVSSKSISRFSPFAANAKKEARAEVEKIKKWINDTATEKRGHLSATIATAIERKSDFFDQVDLRWKEVKRAFDEIPLKQLDAATTHKILEKARAVFHDKESEFTAAANNKTFFSQTAQGAQRASNVLQNISINLGIVTFSPALFSQAIAEGADVAHERNLQAPLQAAVKELSQADKAAADAKNNLTEQEQAAVKLESSAWNQEDEVRKKDTDTTLAFSSALKPPVLNASGATWEDWTKKIVTTFKNIGSIVMDPHWEAQIMNLGRDRLWVTRIINNIWDQRIAISEKRLQNKIKKVQSINSESLLTADTEAKTARSVADDAHDNVKTARQHLQTAEANERQAIQERLAAEDPSNLELSESLTNEECLEALSQKKKEKAENVRKAQASLTQARTDFRDLETKAIELEQRALLADKNALVLFKTYFEKEENFSRELERAKIQAQTDKQAWGLALPEPEQRAKESAALLPIIAPENKDVHEIQPPPAPTASAEQPTVRIRPLKPIPSIEEALPPILLHEDAEKIGDQFLKTENITSKLPGTSGDRDADELRWDAKVEADRLADQATKAIAKRDQLQKLIAKNLENRPRTIAARNILGSWMRPVQEEPQEPLGRQRSPSGASSTSKISFASGASFSDERFQKIAQQATNVSQLAKEAKSEWMSQAEQAEERAKANHLLDLNDQRSLETRWEEEDKAAIKERARANKEKEFKEYYFANAPRWAACLQLDRLNSDNPGTAAAQEAADDWSYLAEKDSTIAAARARGAEGEAALKEAKKRLKEDDRFINSFWKKLMTAAHEKTATETITPEDFFKKVEGLRSEARRHYTTLPDKQTALVAYQRVDREETAAIERYAKARMKEALDEALEGIIHHKVASFSSAWTTKITETAAAAREAEEAFTQHAPNPDEWADEIKRNVHTTKQLAAIDKEAFKVFNTEVERLNGCLNIMREAAKGYQQGESQAWLHLCDVEREAYNSVAQDRNKKTDEAAQEQLQKAEAQAQAARNKVSQRSGKNETLEAAAQQAEAYFKSLQATAQEKAEARKWGTMPFKKREHYIQDKIALKRVEQSASEAKKQAAEALTRKETTLAEHHNYIADRFINAGVAYFNAAQETAKNPNSNVAELYRQEATARIAAAEARQALIASLSAKNEKLTEAQESLYNYYNDEANFYKAIIEAEEIAAWVTKEFFLKHLALVKKIIEIQKKVVVLLSTGEKESELLAEHYSYVVGRLHDAGFAYEKAAQEEAKSPNSNVAELYRQEAIARIAAAEACQAMIASLPKNNEKLTEAQKWLSGYNNNSAIIYKAMAEQETANNRTLKEKYAQALPYYQKAITAKTEVIELLKTGEKESELLAEDHNYIATRFNEAGIDYFNAAQEEAASNQDVAELYRQEATARIAAAEARQAMIASLPAKNEKLTEEQKWLSEINNSKALLYGTMAKQATADTASVKEHRIKAFSYYDGAITSNKEAIALLMTGKRELAEYKKRRAASQTNLAFMYTQIALQEAAGEAVRVAIFQEAIPFYERAIQNRTKAITLLSEGKKKAAENCAILSRFQHRIGWIKNALAEQSSIEKREEMKALYGEALTHLQGAAASGEKCSAMFEKEELSNEERSLQASWQQQREDAAFCFCNAWKEEEFKKGNQKEAELAAQAAINYQQASQVRAQVLALGEEASQEKVDLEQLADYWHQAGEAYNNAAADSLLLEEASGMWFARAASAWKEKIEATQRGEHDLMRHQAELSKVASEAAEMILETDSLDLEKRAVACERAWKAKGAESQ